MSIRSTTRVKYIFIGAPILPRILCRLRPLTSSLSTIQIHHRSNYIQSYYNKAIGVLTSLSTFDTFSCQYWQLIVYFKQNTLLISLWCTLHTMLHTQSALGHYYKVIWVSYATSPAIYKIPPHGIRLLSTSRKYFSSCT